MFALCLSSFLSANESNEANKGTQALVGHYPMNLVLIIFRTQALLQQAISI